MGQPILQVVIPAYGESPYLRATLESAVENLSENVKITVLEDPSESKNIAETVKDFSNRVDYQINSTRLGIAGNFNKAIEISEARFTLICGSDDLILGDLSNELSEINKNDVVACISRVKVINSEGRYTSSTVDLVKKALSPKKNIKYILNNKKFLSSLLLGDWLYFPSIAWETRYLKNHLFDEGYKTALDLNMLFRLIELDYKFLYIPSSKFAYRRHSESVSSKLATNTSRFIEEYKCHELAKNISLKKKWYLNFILAKLAFSIRLHVLVIFFRESLKYKKKNYHKYIQLLFYKV